MKRLEYTGTKESYFISSVLFWTSVLWLTEKGWSRERNQAIIILFYAENYKATFKVILLSE